MTKKEAIEFLTNTKVHVRNKSKEIQEKLFFSLGFKWRVDSKSIQHTNMPFIFIDSKHITYGSDIESFFYSDKYKEITLEDILNINIEPQYRPFKSVEECIEEMKKHQPFGWLKAKNKDFYLCITSMWNICCDGKITASLCKIDDHSHIYNRLSDIFESHTFLDGTPFGIKEDV